MVADLSRRPLTNDVHCSANLTKLMKAERINRVRSGSGRCRSFALKSMIRAALANRVLFHCVSAQGLETRDS